MQKPRFYKHYQHVVVEDLLLLFNINSIMQLPQIHKVVLNTSSKLYVLEKKQVARAFAALNLLVGQFGKITLAHNSIAAFKLRQHNLLGCKVSLRRAKMYIFLDKLLTFVLPCVRELNNRKGNEFNSFGNINLGVENLLLFNDLQPFFDFFDSISGINITVISFFPRIPQQPECSQTRLKGRGWRSVLLSNSTSFTSLHPRWSQRVVTGDLVGEDAPKNLQLYSINRNNLPIDKKGELFEFDLQRSPLSIASVASPCTALLCKGTAYHGEAVKEVIKNGKKKNKLFRLLKCRDAINPRDELHSSIFFSAFQYPYSFPEKGSLNSL